MKFSEIGRVIQVLSVVVGVVISVLSFSATRKSEAEARLLEAQKPFLELRQKLYVEAIKAADVLATPEGRSQGELDAAKRRFRELYVGELSMVEEREVEVRMVRLARQVDPDLLKLNAVQKATFDLAHGLRDTFTASWGVDKK